MEQKLLNHTISETLPQKIAAVNYYAYGQAGGLTLTILVLCPKEEVHLVLHSS